jgi:hypothetical protein
MNLEQSIALCLTLAILAIIPIEYYVLRGINRRAWDKHEKEILQALRTGVCPQCQGRVVEMIKGFWVESLSRNLEILVCENAKGANQYFLTGTNTCNFHHTNESIAEFSKRVGRPTHFKTLRFIALVPPKEK